MEEKESPESGLLPVSGGGGEIVMNTAANVVNTGGLGGDLIGKKKRGRPRKYDSDGNLRIQYVKSPAPPSGLVHPPPGFTLSHSSSSSDYSSKRGRGLGRGRPPGSGNWQLLASLGELFAETAGGDFTPHVVNVFTGEDVAGKVLSISQKGPRGICILAANGAVSNVTIRQPGSFTICENGGVKSRTGGLSVSLAGPDGRVIGGGIAGLLMAASPIQIVVGSFVPNGYKTHKRKHQYEHTPPSMLAAPNVVTSATPISQSSPIIDNTIQIPTTQLPVQSHGGSDNGTTSNKENSNSMSTGTADWNGSEPVFHQRQYPDINVSAPLE
ncbi:hypothetical protein LguiB_035054 [Lonicera macranthoides]